MPLAKTGDDTARTDDIQMSEVEDLCACCDIEKVSTDEEKTRMQLPISSTTPEYLKSLGSGFMLYFNLLK